MHRLHYASFFFFFNDTATTEIYTLSLHDALPIYLPRALRESEISFPSMDSFSLFRITFASSEGVSSRREFFASFRSEEHTSELQSRPHLVCRLLLEKKKKQRDVSFRRIH